jgi:glutamate 5-kinase
MFIHARPRRAVVKVGSALLTDDEGGLDLGRFRGFAAILARHRETQCVVVSSGAVAGGSRALGLGRPAFRLAKRQAAAAVGQTELMRHWSEALGEEGLQVGQILLTDEVVTDRARYLNARRTFGALFRAGVVAVVNENDVLAGNGVGFGDNDNLAAYTAALIEADLLVLLTDVPGVFDGDPREASSAQLIERAQSATELEPYCFASRSVRSVGGMRTKLEAADRAASYGTPTVIASGRDPSAIDTLLRGGHAGTRIEAWPRPLSLKRHWIRVQRRVSGELVVDAGAEAALEGGGTSLLPNGIRSVSGRFGRGDVVAICGLDGAELGRGLAALDFQEVERVRGLHSSRAAEVLGRRAVVVRAEDLVLNGRRPAVPGAGAEAPREVGA